MRRIVACPQCKRQYDASKLAIGQRFRCHCTAKLTVQKARGHDADVVCCSTCGGTREKGAHRCDFCGADFTLHERDLDTVCPQCLSRVSDRARFCHHCGTRISPEMVAGDESALPCPCCGPDHPLRSRAEGEVSILECNRCVGFWLSNDSFRHLTEQAAAKARDVDRRSRARKARAEQRETPPKARGHYRPCAICNQLMVRQNYGRRSGVVVDVCKHHGVWFDADELPRILQWIQSGGLARANEEQAAQQAKEESLRRRMAPVARGEQLHDDYHAPASVAIGRIALNGLAQWLFKF